jgi:hypothetical protein
MPDLKLHIYCDVDGGSVQGSFTPECGAYNEHKRWIGWGVMKRLAEKKKERLEGEDQNLTGGKL